MMVVAISNASKIWAGRNKIFTKKETTKTNATKAMAVKKNRVRNRFLNNEKYFQLKNQSKVDCLFFFKTNY